MAFLGKKRDPSHSTCAPRFKFRWTYVLSGFLVFGVLSLTIGTEDPVAIAEKRIQTRYTQVFRLNKDPKTASLEALAGPEEKTYPLDSPTLNAFIKDLRDYGALVSAQSFARARADTDANQIQVVAQAAKTYLDLQLAIYRNYMRLAHDAEFKTYRKIDAFGGFVDFLRTVDPAHFAAYSARYAERWARANQAELNTPGARAFTPDAYEFLNIQIDPKTAEILYSPSGLKQPFNLRNVEDASGHYTRVELFMNAFQKQMAEYEAIANPKDKGEYLKLMQFAAIRESMANRWAIRRMSGAAIYDASRSHNERWIEPKYSAPNGKKLDASPKIDWDKLTANLPFNQRRVYTPVSFQDKEITACAPDLVSFRLAGKKGTVNDLEAYSSLWQQDRYQDLVKTASNAAAYSTFGKQLLSPNEYAELYGKFVMEFPAFLPFVLQKYQGKPDAILQHYLTDAIAPTSSLTAVAALSRMEEMAWSTPRRVEDDPTAEKKKPDPNAVKDPDAEIIAKTAGTIAHETFFLASFPGDPLTIPAIVERYVDRAYMHRVESLAAALLDVAGAEVQDASALVLPSGNPPEFVEEKDPYGTDTIRRQLTARERAEWAEAHPPNPNPSATPVRIYPEVEKPEHRRRAMELAATFLAPKEKRWKAAVSQAVEKALNEKLGVGVTTANGNPAGLGFLFTKDQERYDAFSSDLMKVASIGARGVQMQNALDKVEKGIEGELLQHWHCVSDPNDPSSHRTCSMRYDEDPTKTKDVTQTQLYLGYAPFRRPVRDFKIDDLILPENANQLSQFFRRKLGLVAAFDNSKVGYAEPELARKITENEVVMRALDRLFGEIDQIAQQADGEDDDQKSSCSSILTQTGGEKGVKRPPKKKRRPASDESLTAQQCSKPENDQAEAHRKALEAAIVPGAKKAYQDFLKAMNVPGDYVDPELAKRQEAADWEKNRRSLEKMSADIRNARPVQDQLSIRNVNPSWRALQKLKDDEVSRENARKGEEQARKWKQEQDLRRKYGYFRVGKTHAYDKQGGEFYVPKERQEETRKLYVEALGMLGISEDVTGETGTFRVKGAPWFPNRVTGFKTTEHLLYRHLGGKRTRLLERMVATVTDQRAMGQVLEQEAISKGPILTLQSHWNWKKDEKREPILLRKLAKYYSPKYGWNEEAYQVEFKKTLASAAKNDVGKVETFCRADIKAYKTDDDFKKMYTAVTGIRGALSGDPSIKKWDDEIKKETRTWGQAFVEDYIEPHTTALMVAMLAVVLIQVVSNFVLPGSGVLTTTLFGQALGWLGRIAFLQITGNVGILALVFNFQTYMMIHTYHFMMPPQLAFTFQVANSQIQQMEANRIDGSSIKRFSEQDLVDRERLRQMREELLSQQLMTNVAIAGEILQAGAFTIPGALRTLGITGAKNLKKLASASSQEFVEDAIRIKKATGKSLAENIREKGFSKGMNEWWATSRAMLKTLNRVGVVDGTEKAQRGLSVLLGNKLGKEILTDKASVRKVLESVIEKNVLKARSLFEEVNEAELKRMAKLAENVDLQTVEREFPAFVEKLRKTAIEGGTDPQAFVVYLRQGSDKLREEFIRQRFGPTGVKKWLYARKLQKEVRGEALLSENANVESLLKKLDEAKALGNDDTETAAFFRSLTPSDLGKFRKYVYGNEALDVSVRSQVKKAYKLHEYLEQDWKSADGIAQAVRRFSRTKMADLYIDADGEVFTRDHFKRDPRTGTIVGIKKVPDPLHPGQFYEKRLEFQVDIDDFYQHPETFESGTIPLQKSTPKAPLVDRNRTAFQQPMQEATRGSRSDVERPRARKSSSEKPARKKPGRQPSSEGSTAAAALDPSDQ